MRAFLVKEEMKNNMAKVKNMVNIIQETQLQYGDLP